MANTGRTSQDALSTSSRDLRITGESMGEFLPGEPQALPSRPEITDVVIQLFTHRSVTEPILVPAVVEPLLVLVLAGAARVEERGLGASGKLPRSVPAIFSSPVPMSRMKCAGRRTEAIPSKSCIFIWGFP